MLNKINNYGFLVFLGKEDYFNVGRKLFGIGFEVRFKVRVEIVKILMDVGLVGRGRF